MNDNGITYAVRGPSYAAAGMAGILCKIMFNYRLRKEIVSASDALLKPLTGTPEEHQVSCVRTMGKHPCSREYSERARKARPRRRLFGEIALSTCPKYLWETVLS